MASYTPNLNLYKPDATDDYDDFREKFNENMDKIDGNDGNQNLATTYDDTATYAVGDYVIYNGLLYKCDTAVTTAETFDPTKWTHVVVTDEMGGGSGGHTIYDKDGNALAQESGLQFTGAVTVSDDSGNGRTVVNIESGGGSIFGFAIDENNKLFEGTINDFNQSLSYTATEDAIALCYFRGGVGTWQFLSINGVYIRLYGEGTNQAVSYSVPIRKGDVVASRSESYSESCYFLLSVYGIKQGTNGIFAPVIYSDTERKIGIWRDNKPLYQKTVHIGALIQDSSWHGVSHGVANLDKCISIEAICIATNGTEFYPINLYRPTTNTGVMVYATASDVYYMNNYYSEMEDAYFTIRYTKTTDSAGSGDWTTDGTPTIHYSTNEQVIGTWIDGKPLYQKTFNVNTSIAQNTTYVVGDITGFDIVNVSGIALTSSTSGFNIPYYNSTSEQAQLWWGSNELKFYQKGYNITGLKITIQYTKTTD